MSAQDRLECLFDVRLARLNNNAAAVLQPVRGLDGLVEHGWSVARSVPFELRMPGRNQ